MTTDQINIPTGYRLAPELKTERIPLRIKPSIKEILKKRADDKKVSLNEYINQVLESSI